MARYPCFLAYLFLLCCALEVTSGAPKQAHDVPQRLKKANDVIMKEKGSSAYEKLLILTGKNAQQKSKAVENGPEPKAAATVENAFSDNIDTCLFQYWKSVVSGGKVDCATKGFKPLCYGPTASQPKALFVVCYDTDRLIPVFTAHVVTPVVGSVSTRPTFKKDMGAYAPINQAEVNDYDTKLQTWPEFDYKKNFYCAKGHLVPNADYGQNSPDEAATTFILTNVAPQWQKFNGGNWLNMEKAVRNYANSKNRNVYVFTGTGGDAEDENNKKYELNKRVMAPQYFWILVCDPTLKQMVIYVGTNPVGNQLKTKVKGCNGDYMTENLGKVDCYSYAEVDGKADYADFVLPTMNTANCPTNVKGKFLTPKWS